MEEKKTLEKREEFEALQLMGLFWVFLGIIVLIAIFFTPTTPGKITNLISGLAFEGIGWGAFLKGRANRRKRKAL